MEKRTLRTTTILTLHAKWPGLTQGFELRRQRTVKGVTSEEVVYGITSLKESEANAKRLLGLTRGHWGIENRQPDNCPSSLLCAAVSGRYHSRGAPTGVGRMV